MSPLSATCCQSRRTHTGIVQVEYTGETLAQCNFICLLSQLCALSFCFAVSLGSAWVRGAGQRVPAEAVQDRRVEKSQNMEVQVTFYHPRAGIKTELVIPGAMGQGRTVCALIGSCNRLGAPGRYLSTNNSTRSFPSDHPPCSRQSLYQPNMMAMPISLAPRHPHHRRLYCGPQTTCSGFTCCILSSTCRRKGKNRMVLPPTCEER